MTLEQIIAAWGAPAVLLGCFVEGDTAALIGGMITHRGLGHWAVMAGAAALGAFLSDQIWFAISRLAPDRGLLARLRAKAKASPLNARIESHAHLMAFVFRFIPGARIAGPILLAQMQISWPAFAVIDAVAVAIWAAALTAIGYHFGRAAEHLLGHLPAHHWGWLTLGVAGAGLLWHLRFRRRG